MTDTAAQVPSVFDVLIDGHGYITARAVDPNMPFRVQQQSLTYTPTFVERQNVSGAYGDNQQDFFLTASQNDWSGGEGRRFFHPADDASKRSFWTGTKCDLSVPGQVTIMPATKTVTFAAAVSGVGTNQFPFFVASSTNLYEYDGTTITDRGAHGAGGLPTSIAYDGLYIYLAGTSTTALRRYNTSAHTFSTFNANSLGVVTFLNNAIWASGAGALNYYDTAGTATAAYTWKDGTGGALGNRKRIIPYGGQIMVMTPSAQNTYAAELWVADTTGARRVAELPRSFSEQALTQTLGTVFVIGAEYKGAALGSRTAIYYYANGTLEKLWASPTYTTGTFGGQDIVPYQNGLLFTDIVSGTIKYYDLSTGAVSSVTSWTPTASDVYFSATGSGFVIMSQNATATTYFFDSTVATAATLSSSLIDFENSLTKLLRGIKVDFTSATDGDGGSVDIAYQIDSLDGAYTTLKTGATSGTEYPGDGTTIGTGHSISVRITLNKGTSTKGPTLKRFYVRGAPILQSYRVNEFIFDLGGDTSEQNPVRLRNGAEHTLTGEQMRANLAANILAATPVSVTDRTGTYTAVLEPANCEFDLTRPGQWYARVRVREV